MTEKIDKVLLNRLLGLPIFSGMMWLLFQMTFTLGMPPMEWIEAGFGWLGDLITAHTAPGLLQSLLVDGIIGGVGGVIVFLPNIILLFLGIALLEDTGYMSRAAFFHKSVAGNVLFSIYLIGIILAILMAKVFRTWLVPGESEPFVMELPAYRLPSITNKHCYYNKL